MSPSTWKESNKIHGQGKEKRPNEDEKYREATERILRKCKNPDQEIGEVLGMPEEECRKGEQERND